MGTCNVSVNQQNLWVREQHWDSGTSLLFPLLTFRMKFLEDSTLDTTPEADTEKGSSATEGKGIRRSLFFALSDTSHNLLSTPPCPSLPLSSFQSTSRPVAVCMRPGHILGSQGTRHIWGLRKPLDLNYSSLPWPR